MRKLKVGRRVSYTGNDGFTRAAIVLGTNETIKPGTKVTQPDEGNARLLVYKNTDGSTYIKDNVAPGEGKGQFVF